MAIRSLRAILVAAAFFVAAAEVRADSITGGDLFAVFANTGSFADGTNLAQNYTVVHFLTYAASPTSEFPSPLVPLLYPASGFPARIPAVPGGEFFLIGSVAGAGDFPDHLLLSNSNPGKVPSDLFDKFEGGDALHDALIAGAMGLATGVPIYQVNAGAFWTGMGVDPTDFFGLRAAIGNNGAIVNLRPGQSPLAAIGSEEVFGFSPPFSNGFLDFLVFDGELDPNYVWTDGEGNARVAVPIPEPATALLLLGALGAARLARRRGKA
jgi:hypothetical protein